MSALTMMLCNFDQYDGGSEQNHERQRGRDHDERAALGAECQIHQGKADIGRIGIVCIQPIYAHVSELERSEVHTSELQSLLRIAYAVFWLKTTLESRDLPNNRTR